MRLTYILKVAYRNLLGHKMRTLLTIFGVAISVGFVCFLLAFGYGLQKIATDQIANGDSLKMLDVTVGSSRVVSLDQETINRIYSFDEVAHIYPRVAVASDIQYESSKVDSVTYGLNADLLGIVKPVISVGQTYGQDDVNKVLLNTTVARQLTNADPASLIGQEVTIRLVLRTELFSDEAATTKLESAKYTVSGIMDEGSTAYVYVPLNAITSYGVDRFSAIKVELSDSDLVERVKPQIEHLGFKVDSIKNTIDQVNQFFSVFQVVLLIIGAVAVIVAGLGMFNTLTISLMEKTREVGIMKVLGAKKKDIGRIFIAESLIVGVMGSVIGMAVSVAIGGLINLSISIAAKSSGNAAVTLFCLPWQLILIIIGIAVTISVLTGLYPSRRATKINPLDALRYE
jgi:ABC-type antimicrobial peptide transport system permease subunit